ncbi:hypothetical protein LQW54_001496 [Pestalotiopsis sp. IQ-011]
MKVAHIGNMDLQSQSSFFSKLPLEIRRMIYACYCDFRVIIYMGGTRVRRNRRPNALALLSTCRAVHVEIGKSWMRHMTLSCDIAENMISYYIRKYPRIRPLDQLRKIELGGLHTRIRNEDELNSQIDRHVEWLSQLRLDMLSITIQWRDMYNLEAAFALAHAGYGWRNLEIITRAEVNSLDRSHANLSEPGRPCPRCIFCCSRCCFEYITKLKSITKRIAARDGGNIPKVVMYVASNLYKNITVGRVDREFWAPILSDGATSTSDEVARNMLDVVSEQDCIYSFSRGRNANMGDYREDDPAS